MPGSSRSGTTISAGLAAGLEPTASVRFAFLMSIPVILGGGLVEGFDLTRANLPVAEVLSYGLGAAVAAVSAWVAILLVFGAVRRGKLSWYALYCALVGLAALLFGLLRP